MKKPLISVVIPTLNEAKNISALIHKIQEELRKQSYEIIVVDDQSEDKTYEVVRKISDADDRVHAFIHQGRQELGDSILQGIKKSSGKIVIGMDADFNHDPKTIHYLLKAIRRADVVVASRFLPHGGMENMYRYIASWGFNIILRFVFGFPVTDSTSGFYAIRRSALGKLPLARIYQGYGEYHLRLVFLAQQAGFRLEETAVFYQNRIHGRSKSQFLKMLRDYLRTAYELRFSGEN